MVIIQAILLKKTYWAINRIFIIYSNKLDVNQPQDKTTNPYSEIEYVYLEKSEENI